MVLPGTPDDTVLDVRGVAEEIPEGWSGVIFPTDDSELAVVVLPYETTVEDNGDMTLPDASMLCIAILHAVAHSGFSDAFIMRVLGDDVERIGSDEQKPTFH